jgi:hypothetical protein
MSPTLPERLELAGLVDAQGVIGRTMFPSSLAPVPRSVKLDKAGENLRWREPHAVSEEDWFTYWDFQDETEGMLDTFRKINGPSDVLDFAKRYGPLRICSHGLPSSHRPFYFSLDPVSMADFCQPEGYPDHCHEPLERWRFYVTEANNLLEVGASLWQQPGKPAPRSVWAKLLGDAPLLSRLGESVVVDRWIVMAEVNSWLQQGNIHVFWGWHDPEPVIRLNAGTFGLLALQLATALGRSSGVVICYACRTPYLPDRKPQSGRRNYCQQPNCQVIGNRLRVADYKRRKKEEGHGKAR